MGKAATRKTTTHSADDEGHPPTTNLHNTRKKNYRYSHFQAPYTPAPARNTNRPPLPSLAARRKLAGQNKNVEPPSGAASTQSNDSGGNTATAQPEPTLNDSSNLINQAVGGAAIPSGTQSLFGTPASSEPMVLDRLVPLGLETVNEDAEESPFENASGHTSAEVAAAATNTNAFSADTTSQSTVSQGVSGVNSNAFGRQNQVGVWTTPVSVRLQVTPAADWASLNFDDDTIPLSRIPNFSPQRQLQFNQHFPITASVNHPGSSSTLFSSELPNLTVGGLGNSVDSLVGSSTTTLASHDPPAQYPRQSADYAALHDAVIQMLPSHPISGQNVSAPLSLAPSMTIAPGSATASAAMATPSFRPTSASTSLQTTTPSHSDLVALITPTLPPGFPFQVPGFPAPGAPHYGHQTVQNPVQVLRQSNFGYDQVVCIHLMTKRWYFYLATEDAFPTDLNLAREVTIIYAAGILRVSRETLGVNNRMFDFVRKKESHGRNDFQDGLIYTIEKTYEVNRGSSQRLKELLTDRNFIYVEYDPNNKKAVSGRYRHPAIVAMIKNILFSRTSRGRPLGVRFMNLLMVDTTAGEVQGYEDKTATSGVPVPLIALACTLVLYGLHAIRAGDWSERKASAAPKPIAFTERKYAKEYRGFVQRLKDYHRLGELREFHMKEVMKEYLEHQKDGGTDSDEEETINDNDRYSDGE